MPNATIAVTIGSQTASVTTSVGDGSTAKGFLESLILNHYAASAEKEVESITVTGESEAVTAAEVATDVAAAPQPRFRVGDKVRIRHSRRAETHVVSGITSNGKYELSGSVFGWWGEDELEPAE